MLTKFNNRNLADWMSNTLPTDFMRELQDMYRGAMSQMDVSDGKVFYTFDLPGVKKENLSLTQEGKFLKIKAERKGRVNSVYDSQVLIDAVCDINSLDANLADGVLTVSFNIKQEEKKVARKIEVR